MQILLFIGYVWVSGIRIFCACTAISMMKHVSILYWNTLQKASCTRNCRKASDLTISAQRRYVIVLGVSTKCGFYDLEWNILQSTLLNVNAILPVSILCLHGGTNCLVLSVWLQCNPASTVHTIKPDRNQAFLYRQHYNSVSLLYDLVILQANLGWPWCWMVNVAETTMK